MLGWIETQGLPSVRPGFNSYHLKKIIKKTGDAAQVQPAECFPGVHTALGFTSSTIQNLAWSCSLHTGHCLTWEMDEEQVVQDPSLVHNEFEASPGCMEPHPSPNKNKLLTECVQ